MEKNKVAKFLNIVFFLCAMKMKFLYICLAYPILALSSLFAQWDNAEYIALGSISGGGSQRVLMFFDSDFNQLGYVSLQTSAYDGANSIAYGNGLVPNQNGLPGMLLQRNTPEEDYNYFTVNTYADPLTSGVSSGGELPRSLPANFGSVFVASSGTTEYIDRVVAINSASTDGVLIALVNRYNKDALGGEHIFSSIYRYKMPINADTSFPVYRVEDDAQAPRWDVDVVEWKDFTTGVFSAPYDSEVTDQLACLSADGTVYFYQVKDPKTHVIDFGTMSVASDGKDILSIWGGDDYSLFVLYSDYSVMEYDTITKEIRSTSFLSADYGILDMVKTSPVVVPEPAEYAMLFGIAALGFIFFRRRK